jgi:hypothetical protein
MSVVITAVMIASTMAPGAATGSGVAGAATNWDPSG